MATSVGGVLTGRGADFILIDDPMKPCDAMSESRRAGVNDWFDSTLYSRLNEKNNGAIVIVMQRLHEDDLVGHVLKQEGLGSHLVARDRGSRRALRRHDAVRRAGVFAPRRRSPPPRARIARNP